MAVYDMADALHTARETHSSRTLATLDPETAARYEKPITTAQKDGLPIIDISSFLAPLQATSPAACETTRLARQQTAAAINAACTTYGFFYLTGHGIPLSTLDEIIGLARAFFALPLHEKEKIKRFDAGGPEGGDSARGYQGLGENVTGGLQDMQEAVDFYAAWNLSQEEEGDEGGDREEGGVKTLQGPNLWPENPPQLKQVYEEYIARVAEVGRALVHAMGCALDLGPVGQGDDEDEEVFLRHCEESFWVLRMINYPPLPSTFSSSTSPSTSEDDPSQFSCGAHTDYGCVTLLLTDPTPGALQVQLKDGTWLPADPVRGAFVVNVGDMIERWTNGGWRSTLHRVIHRGAQDGQGRISVPFFFEPNFDALVKPLEKCVQRSGRERMHEGSTYGEHLLTKVFSNFYYSKRTDW